MQDLPPPGNSNLGAFHCLDCDMTSDHHLLAPSPTLLDCWLKFCPQLAQNGADFAPLAWPFKPLAALILPGGPLVIGSWELLSKSSGDNVSNALSLSMAGHPQCTLSTMTSKRVRTRTQPLSLSLLSSVLRKSILLSSCSKVLMLLQVWQSAVFLLSLLYRSQNFDFTSLLDPTIQIIRCHRSSLRRQAKVGQQPAPVLQWTEGVY